MYLPKTKYDKPQYSRGTSMYRKNGKPYVGWYFRTFENKYYTGKEPLSTSEEIYPDKATSTGPVIKYTSDANIQPTSAQRGSGTFKRYFLQDKRSGKIIECKLEKYKHFKQKDYITTAQVEWDLTQPSEDRLINGYPYQGSESKNRETIKKLEQKIKGISSYIKNYAEFANEE